MRRLESDWRRDDGASSSGERRGGHDDDALLQELMGDAGLAALDRFDRVQLAEVVRVCRQQGSLSAAGRELFAVSRENRATANDADRLRKYLARFGLDHARVRGR
jgi:transcriptional regulatory protein RtcR